MHKLQGGNKMNKKILLALFLVLAMTVTACSPSTTPVEPDQPTTDTPAEGIEASISVQVENSWRGYYEDAIARVKEKNPNATIELIETGSFDHLDVLDWDKVFEILPIYRNKRMHEKVTHYYNCYQENK